MIPQDVMMDLATIGLSADQARVVASMLSRVEDATKGESEVGKEKARARWRKWKESRSTNVSKRLQTTANVSKQLAGAEDRTSNLDIPSKEESKKQNAAVRDVVEFKDKLAPHLEADLLEAFVKVRRAKRSAMTGYAAGLFIGDAAKCNMTVSEAATECVRSSWITVKPEYFQGRQRAGPAPPKIDPVKEAANRLMEQFDAVTPSETQANPAHLRLVAFSGGNG